MGSIDEISTVCRLCLVKDQVNKPIFDGNSDIKQTFEKINSCLPVKVSPDDDLPKKICDGCFAKLDMLYDFRSTSLESEKHLIELLEQAGLKSKPLTNDHESEKPVTVKQENIESSDRLSEDGNDVDQVGDNSRSYITQQQKLRYQKDFKFSTASGSKLEESIDDPDESEEPEEPKPKRVRRAAALTAIKSLPIETEDEDEEDLDGTMEITKEEDEDSEPMDNTDFAEGDEEVPSTSTEDQQPGPSGVGKNVEAPKAEKLKNSVSSAQRQYNCVFCGKKFPTWEEVQSHKNSVHKHDPVSCPHCGEFFRTNEELDEHKCLKRKTPYKCERCSETLCNFLDFIFHENMCPGVASSSIQCISSEEENEGDGSCEVCHENFDNWDSLLNHRKKIHSLSHYCHICKKTYSSNSSLKKHRRSQHKDLDESCFEFKNRKSLKLTKINCSKCCKTFSNCDELKSHNCEKLSYKCQSCDEIFTQKAQLTHHERTTHSSKNKVDKKKCPFCEEVFSFASAPYYVHLREHNDGKLICHFCQKEFEQIRIYTDHLKIHQDPQSLTCEQCNKRFSSVGNLKRHRKTVHDRIVILQNHIVTPQIEKLLACEYCGKHFTKSEVLKLHIRKHIREKPYSCKDCRKRFAQAATLRVHIKVTHNAERPHMCVVCEKKFASRDHLDVHLRCHDI